MPCLCFEIGPTDGVFDEASARALARFASISNFENKMREDGRIWKTVLSYLEELAGRA